LPPMFKVVPSMAVACWGALGSKRTGVQRDSLKAAFRWAAWLSCTCARPTLQFRGLRWDEGQGEA
jgi:hypothetical protein